MSARRFALALVAASLVVGCGPGDATTTTADLVESTTSTTSTLPETTTTAPVPTTTTPSSSTSTAPPTTQPPADLTVVVPVAPLSEMGSAWTEVVFAYGEGIELLGTSPGGDNLMFGPEYGTQTGDGRWWFMDAAKQRVAVYSPEGAYQGEVVLPPEVLVEGVYFQYQMPQALDDGTLAVGGLRGGGSAVLRLIDMVPSVLDVASDTSWVTTDGTYLYGFDVDGVLQRLDLATSTAEPIEYLRTRAGTRFMVRRTADAVVVELPDAGLARTLQMRFSEDSGVVVQGGLQVESGADGTLFVLIIGAPESDETLGVGALITIAPDGAVTSEDVVDPFSSSDPGSPANLGVTPGTSTPWFMAVWDDGVHVWTHR